VPVRPPRCRRQWPNPRHYGEFVPIRPPYGLLGQLSFSVDDGAPADQARLGDFLLYARQGRHIVDVPFALGDAPEGVPFGP
jgi:hypothetical protein